MPTGSHVPVALGGAFNKLTPEITNDLLGIV
jgi:hypothetical protein